MENYNQFPLIAPPQGLFEKIFLAIKREAEKREGKRVLLSLIFLSLVSGLSVPYFGIVFLSQIKESGIFYFLSTLKDLQFSFFKEFLFAILESLPVFEIGFFFLSLTLCLFTLRLFLHKRKILLKYLLKQNYCLVF